MYNIIFVPSYVWKMTTVFKFCFMWLVHIRNYSNIMYISCVTYMIDKTGPKYISQIYGNDILNIEGNTYSISISPEVHQSSIALSSLKICIFTQNGWNLIPLNVVFGHKTLYFPFKLKNCSNLARFSTSTIIVCPMVWIISLRLIKTYNYIPKRRTCKKLFTS